MSKRAILPAVFALTFGAAGAVQAQNAATTNGSTNPTAAPTTMSAPTTTTTTRAPNSAATTPGAPMTSGTGSATNNAVSTAPANNAGAPVPGANSFTEGQARSRIQDHGVTQVTDLKLDNKGVWRGKGTKDGKSVDVSMDYQGNVVPQ